MTDIRLTKKGASLLALWNGRRRLRNKLGVLFSEADGSRDRKDWPSAAIKYRQIVDFFPTEVAAAIQLGHAYKEMGKYDEAAAAYQAAKEVTPTDDDLHLQIGHLHKVMGNFSQAADSYHQALSLNPTNANAALEFEAIKSHWKEPPPADNRGKIVDDAVPRRKSKELRHLGDKARDGKAWKEASAYYREYLRSVPKDAGIWIQYGHCLKEGGDLAAGEGAYREALQIVPKDADLHLQLGHVLKLQNRLHEAAEAYRRSFILKPLFGAAHELRRLSPLEKLDELVVLEPTKGSSLCIDVSDLLEVMTETTTVSGIQRVQVGILEFLARQRASKSRYEVVFWQHDLLWLLSGDALPDLASVFDDGKGDLGYQRRVVNAAREGSVLLQPGANGTYVSTGVLYRQPKLGARFDRLKQAGMRLGVFMHDFIPLTHQELIDPILTLQFGSAIADAFPQIDFVITNSDHVARETKRLRQKGNYPEIPIRTVPLAHSFKQPVATTQEEPNNALEDLAGREFVLCVGTISAHKNQELLVNAWRLLLDQGIHVPILVLAGRKGHDIDRMMRLLRQTDYLSGHVQIVDGPSDEEVEGLYRNCLFTAFPSYVEGWGLPVGESLSRGKLCVASETTSMPQVGGDFAVYIDPYNVRATTEMLQQLILNREEIQRREQRIRDSFKPRTLSDFAEDFLQSAAELGQLERLGPLTAPENEVLQPQVRMYEWPWGDSLPPFGIQTKSIAGELMLSRGWYEPEHWGAWIDGSSADIRFRVDGNCGRIFRVALQFWSTPWAQKNMLSVRSSCGAQATVAVPGSNFTESTWPAGGRREKLCKKVLVSLDCMPDATGYITLSLEVGGYLAAPWWGESRSIYVGLLQLVYRAIDHEKLVLGESKLFGVSSVEPKLAAVRFQLGQNAIGSTLSRRHVTLGRGWRTTDQGLTWVTNHKGTVSFRSSLKRGAKANVAAKVRNRSRQYEVFVEIRSVCGATSEKVMLRSGADLALQIPQCVAGEGGVIELDLVVSMGVRSTVDLATHQKGAPDIELQGVAYVASDVQDGRLALAETLAFQRNEDDDTEIIRNLVRQDLRFAVAGHIKGSYSLAAVNRQLALSIEEALPGAVRVMQVEDGEPTRNLVEIPSVERASIIALSARSSRQSKREIVISQHWPYWIPSDTADMKVALVPWEESLIAEPLVQTLNEQFDCVFVHTTFVEKALVDSGVVTPIKCIGMPLNLEHFLKIGDERESRRSAGGGSKGPFTFLHVSSCFPRKGVDVLLKAYAEEFSLSDKVKLVIKTFPNPHNTVAEQIARLRSAKPEMAEIQLINQDLALPVLTRLYAGSDAMVLPARGEGFNLGAAEALAAGLQLIVTGWGAHLDFANANNARLIDFALAKSSAHVSPAWSVWAEPSVEDLRRAMREAFVDRHSSRTRERIANGRETAKGLVAGNPTAACVIEGALDVALEGDFHLPKIAWISTWQVRCGIATHSHLMLEHLQSAHSRITLLCDERTDRRDLQVANMPAARVAWKVSEPTSVERLAQEIEILEADAVIVQHQPGLIGFTDLVKLLHDHRISRRYTVVELHNVRELFELEAPQRTEVVGGLAAAARLLVHSIRDLNLMKQMGLVNNVALLPVGATGHARDVPATRTLPKDIGPLLGAYGFFLPPKGFDVLLRAFVRVKDEWPRARLRFVTAEFPATVSAEEIQRCKNLADYLGVADSIEWHTDFLDDESSLYLLSQCDLLILPYKESKESASGAVRVAIASRVPVAVTPVGIFDDVNHAVTRFGGHGVDEIANGIIDLLRHPLLRAEQQRCASEWLDENSWERSAKRLLAITQALAANG